MCIKSQCSCEENRYLFQCICVVVVVVVVLVVVICNMLVGFLGA